MQHKRQIKKSHTKFLQKYTCVKLAYFCVILELLIFDIVFMMPILYQKYFNV